MYFTVLFSSPVLCNFFIRRKSILQNYIMLVISNISKTSFYCNNIIIFRPELISNWHVVAGLRSFVIIAMPWSVECQWNGLVHQSTSQQHTMAYGKLWSTDVTIACSSRDTQTDTKQIQRVGTSRHETTAETPKLNDEIQQQIKHRHNQTRRIHFAI